MDILTGCWPGELYFFKGEGKGKYAAGVILKDKDGKAINLGGASTVFACDWRGTGKLDLLVGNIGGDVHLVPNEGTRTSPAFGKAMKLEADGKAIKAEHGDSHPIAADWDKDGKLDLLVGSGAGSVMFYRNIAKGKTGEPQLAAGETLVAAPKREFDKAPKNCGMRAKICVTDWNGDGQPDLLLGDFNSWTGPAPKLSDDDRKAQKEAQEKQQAIFKDYIPLIQEQAKLQDQAKKAGPDETAEARDKREKQLRDLAKRLQPLQEQLAQAQKELRLFQPQFHYQGNVWLFLRRAPEAKSQPGTGTSR